MNETHNTKRSLYSHIPVMSKEAVELLNPKAGEVIIDGTLGLGGHAKEILKRIIPSGTLIGIDADGKSLEAAKENLKMYTEQCFFINDNFRNLGKALDSLGIKKVNAVLLDIGISSFQLDDESRGFSFKAQGPLDMRLDTKGPISAFDLVNSLSEAELSKIFKEYGEEIWHKRIAGNIVSARKNNPIKTTWELREIIIRSVPRSKRGRKIDPATQSFQALRIAVNRELESLSLALDAAFDRLQPNGRLVVISFHSLEDRIVKNMFREMEKQSLAKVLTKKPLRPGEVEIEVNHRSRSARLRALERL
ncbi:MAG: 16S rRNA (cytosine(1402)-N(4))-methyltransferase RsmH [Candidatus Omnitrophica bacterium]|nr:16S rRNA (cytosine(1402)-N(4))-methyltransferase RsmH [Candidatus Omnitrophota bacterium]